MPGGYEGAARERIRQSQGYRGLDYGGKPTLLDDMTIVMMIWNDGEKYATKDGIQRCWRKANVLPTIWDTDINRDLGRASTP